MKNKEIKKQLKNDVSAISAPDILENIKRADYNSYKGLPNSNAITAKPQNDKPIKSKRKFKLISAIAASLAVIITAAIVIPLAIWGGDTPTVGLEYSLLPDQNAYEVSIGTATAKNIVIASEHNGRPVRQIAKDGFMETDIKSVKIPDSITVIDGNGELEEGAFRDCDYLVNVILSKNITSIGDFAFGGCINLTNIIIPDSVTSIGRNAFSYCESLKNIRIPNSVKNIDMSAFSGCINLTSITIPNGVEVIGDYAFAYCEKLTDIKISDSIIKMGAGVFIGTQLYESQPDGIVYVDKILYGYKGTMPDNAIIDNIRPDTIGIADFAFGNNSVFSSQPQQRFLTLKSVLIPDNVKFIGDSAFYDCRNLESVIIPNSVKYIWEYAFLCCYNLENITFPTNLLYIGALAFHQTQWMYNKPAGLLYINKILYSYVGQMPDNTIINNIRPDTVGIVGGAFLLNQGLKSIVIPDSVTFIGEAVFMGCINLENINIPNGITTIELGTFINCKSLKTITIPDSVTNIGVRRVGMRRIGHYSIYSGVFQGSGLTSITIPKNVKKISSFAFAECYSLENFTVESGNTVYRSEGNCLISGNTLIGFFKNSVIPNSVTRIGSYAFFRTNLTSFTIPSSITFIEWGAFHDSASLESIFIPNSVKYIECGAFYYCDNLTIYAEATSKPDGWSGRWNFIDLINMKEYYYPVVWDYKM